MPIFNVLSPSDAASLEPRVDGLEIDLTAETNARLTDKAETATYGEYIHAYGAVGNDIADDTQAFIDCIATGTQVILLGYGKTYRVHGNFDHIQNILVVGSGSYIRSIDGLKIFNSTTGAKVMMIGVNPLSVSAPASLGDTLTRIIQGSESLTNTTESTVGIVNCFNYAGQGLLGANSPPGFVLHHYTDGAVAQYDNVGSANSILVLNNAFNPLARPDKAAEFIGTGTYVNLKKYNAATLANESLMLIDSLANFLWVKSKGMLLSDKTPDGLPVMSIGGKKLNTYVIEFINNNVAFGYLCNPAAIQMQFLSAPSQTAGIEFYAGKGNIHFKPAEAGKQVTLYDTRGGDDGIKTVQGVNACSTANRPTVSEIGEMWFDFTLNKPIWRNATNNGWVDATGIAV